MRSRFIPRVLRRSIFAPLVIGAALALTPAAASSGPSSEQARFLVTSSLDGKSVLPHGIAWLAYPSLARSKVARVDFLVDGGRVRWTERNPPYRYADDGGYLVTSWLTPGRHRFQVRATAKDGSVATNTVVARVSPADAPGEARRHVATVRRRCEGPADWHAARGVRPPVARQPLSVRRRRPANSQPCVRAPTS